MILTIKKLLERIFGGASKNVFKGMATLALGSATAKIIGIAIIPILTRLYSPEDFGVLSVFTALVAIIAPIVTLRYVVAIPLPKHDGVAFNLLFLSFVLMLALSSFVAINLWLFGEQLLGLFSMEVLGPWWWLIALGILVTAAYELLTMWATRKRNYRVIAKTNILQSIVGSSLKILLGIIAFKPFGLLVGQVFAQGGGIGSLSLSFRRDFRKNLNRVKFSTVKKLAFIYRDYPVYRVPSQFLLILSTQAPLLFVAALFDANTTGQLGLAFLAIGLPMQIFGKTVSKAFYAEASLLGRKQSEQIKEMIISVSKKLVLLAIFPALVLLFMGQWLFVQVFGSEWALAGTFSSLLSIYLVLQFVQAPAAYIFYIFDGQKALLLLSFQRIVIILATFTAAYYLNFNTINTVLAYSLMLSLHYALSIFYAFKFIPTPKRNSE